MGKFYSRDLLVGDFKRLRRQLIALGILGLLCGGQAWAGVAQELDDLDLPGSAGVSASQSDPSPSEAAIEKRMELKSGFRGKQLEGYLFNMIDRREKARAQLKSIEKQLQDLKQKTSSSEYSKEAWASEYKEERSQLVDLIRIQREELRLHRPSGRISKSNKPGSKEASSRKKALEDTRQVAAENLNDLKEQLKNLDLEYKDGNRKIDKMRAAAVQKAKLLRKQRRYSKRSFAQLTRSMDHWESNRPNEMEAAKLRFLNLDQNKAAVAKYRAKQARVPKNPENCKMSENNFPLPEEELKTFKETGEALVVFIRDPDVRAGVSEALRESEEDLRDEEDSKKSSTTSGRTEKATQSDWKPLISEPYAPSRRWTH